MAGDTTFLRGLNGDLVFMPPGRTCKAGSRGPVGAASLTGPIPVFGRH